MNERFTHTHTLEINTIYNENCLDGLKLLPDKSVDLILTDPPYGKRQIKEQTDSAIPKTDGTPGIGIKRYPNRKYLLKCSELQKIF